MIVTVFDRDDNREIYIANPVCGQHFCDTCGDCLVCYAEEDCSNADGHYWVIYESILEDYEQEWLNNLRETSTRGRYAVEL